MRTTLPRLLVALLTAIVAPSTAAAEPFRVLTWNVESNRPGAKPVSDPGVIATQLESLSRDPATRAAIVVLTEVEPKTLPAYRRAVAEGAGADYEAVSGGSGGYRDSDSVVVLVDTARFRVEEAIELHRYAGHAGNILVEEEGSELGALRARSPLALRLVDRTSDASFWLVAVHLARGEEDLRLEQARLLCRWAADRKEPLVLAGDCNFDFDFRTRRGNAAWQAMIDAGVWRWLEPDPLVDSNWADDRNAPPGERRDRYPDSILDFVWVANDARNWRGDSDVVVRPGDFPDDDTTSDHRPLTATFDP